MSASRSIICTVCWNPARSGSGERHPSRTHWTAWSHASTGRLSEARSELIAGLELAEREADRYEQALLLRELVGLAGHTGTEGTGAAERAAAILDAMGVVTSG